MEVLLEFLVFLQHGSVLSASSTVSGEMFTSVLLSLHAEDIDAVFPADVQLADAVPTPVLRHGDLDDGVLLVQLNVAENMVGGKVIAAQSGQVRSAIPFSSCDPFAPFRIICLLCGFLLHRDIRSRTFKKRMQAAALFPSRSSQRANSVVCGSSRSKRPIRLIFRCSRSADRSRTCPPCVLSLLR